MSNPSGGRHFHQIMPIEVGVCMGVVRSVRLCAPESRAKYKKLLGSNLPHYWRFCKTAHGTPMGLPMGGGRPKGLESCSTSNSTSMELEL